MEEPIDPREIRVFLAVAEELHFARAAERLFLTPSRVSQTIRALEAKIGGRLFDRTSRRVSLTPLGEELRSSMTPLYEQMQRAYASVREAASGVAGTVRIGVYTPANGGPHWPEILEVFKATYRNCSVELIDPGMSDSLLDWLRRGDVDLMVLRLPLSDTDMAVGPTLSRDERMLAVARDHPLAGREAVDWEDVGDYAFADAPGFPREFMDAFAPPNTPSGRQIRRVALRTFNEVLMRVASGDIVHPTVASFLESHSDSSIRLVPIRDLPPSEAALVWLRAGESLRVQAFVRTAGEVVASHSTSAS